MYLEVADKSAVVGKLFESAVDGELDDGVGREEVFELAVVVGGFFVEPKRERVVAEVADSKQVVGVVLRERAVRLRCS